MGDVVTSDGAFSAMIGRNRRLSRTTIFCDASYDPTGIAVLY
jgi:hypothetical protein